MTKLPYRYFNGENECPFRDEDIKGRFWWLERNLSHFPEGRVEQIFGETNPVNWPRFIEKAKGNFQELALAYVMWYDYAMHVWGGDEGGEEWSKYFEEPIKERVIHITATIKAEPGTKCTHDD